MEHSEDSVFPLTPNDYQCASCGKSYKTKSGLNKYLKTCGTRDRTACKFCGEKFSTFTGVRLHEIRAHKAEENDAPKQRTEVDVLLLMAESEAKLSAGSHVLKLLSEATGLTKHQIRHRRDKPEYRRLLAINREELANDPRPELLPTPQARATPSIPFEEASPRGVRGMIDSFERLSSPSVSSIQAGQPLVQLTPSPKASSMTKRNQRFHTSQVAGPSNYKAPVAPNPPTPEETGSDSPETPYATQQIASDACDTRPTADPLQSTLKTCYKTRLLNKAIGLLQSHEQNNLQVHQQTKAMLIAIRDSEPTEV